MLWSPRAISNAKPTNGRSWPTAVSWQGSGPAANDDAARAAGPALAPGRRPKHLEPPKLSLLMLPVGSAELNPAGQVRQGLRS